MKRFSHERGFTLIELVVAMSLSVIVICFMTMFMTAPIEAYHAQARRADLVDSADSTLRLMARDIRLALPNSVRVRQNGTIWAIEMLNAVDAMRYRSTGSVTAPADQELDFTQADSTFTVIGHFKAAPADYGNGKAYLAIYNVGTAPADAYQNAVMTGLSTINIATNPLDVSEDQVTLSPAFRFQYQSPEHRVYLVSGPVTYLCAPGTKSLRRYAGYTVASSQASRDTDPELVAAGAASSLIATDVSACQFSYTANTVSTRSSLVTLGVTLTRANPTGGNESAHLLREVHVENAP